MEPASSTIDPSTLEQEARRAVTAIRENLGQHADDDIIETNVRSLRNLAGIIEILLEQAHAGRKIGAQAVNALLPEDAMGIGEAEERVPGKPSYWVPLPFFQAERARNLAARSERDAFQRTLQEIAQRPMGGHAAMAILFDWEQIAREFQSLACATLAGAPPHAGMGRKAA